MRFFACALCASALRPESLVTLPCGYSVHRLCLLPVLRRARLPCLSASSRASSCFKCPMSLCKRALHPLPQGDLASADVLASDAVLAAVLQTCLALAGSSPPSSQDDATMAHTGDNGRAQCVLFRALSAKQNHRRAGATDVSASVNRKHTAQLSHCTDRDCSDNALPSAMDQRSSSDKCSELSYIPPPSPGPVCKAIDSFEYFDEVQQCAQLQSPFLLSPTSTQNTLYSSKDMGELAGQCASMQSNRAKAGLRSLQRDTFVSDSTQVVNQPSIDPDLISTPVMTTDVNPSLPITTCYAMSGIISSSQSQQPVSMVSTIHLSDSYQLQPLSLNYADFKDHLECKLCHQLLYEPITFFPCGHSAYRSCVLCTLDYNSTITDTVNLPTCFYCHVTLQERYIHYHTQPPNFLLQQFILLQFPDQFKQRLYSLSREITSLLEEVPIFICSLALPGQICHLHVFEPRYRLMMRRIIAPGSCKTFGMCLPRPTGRPVEYGVTLKVKRIEFMQDGRSIVEASGIYPFRIISQSCKDGYCVARIQQMADTDTLRLDDMPPPNNLPLVPKGFLPLSSTSKEKISSCTLNSIYTSRLSPMNLPSDDDMNIVQVPSNSSPTTVLETQSLLYAPTCRDLLCFASCMLHKFLDRLPDDSARVLFKEHYGCMPCDPVLFTYWCANLLPVLVAERYKLLTIRSARARLALLLKWWTSVEKQMRLRQMQQQNKSCSDSMAADSQQYVSSTLFKEKDDSPSNKSFTSPTLATYSDHDDNSPNSFYPMSLPSSSKTRRPCLSVEQESCSVM